MIGLDTNVIVRYLVQDDPKQAAIVRSHITRSLRQKPVCRQVNIAQTAIMTTAAQAVSNKTRRPFTLTIIAIATMLRPIAGM